MLHPTSVERLIVLNMPHPTGLARELAHNPAQHQAGEYARAFQHEQAHLALRDTAILPGGLNGSWDWVDAPLTIVTLPEAGHFVQHDDSEAVTITMVTWLHATTRRPAPS
ncbi:MAG: hypothetical protein ACRDR6_16250 [Pseudonocardiaceae bacterium]